jgi:hypothetical protein
VGRVVNAGGWLKRIAASSRRAVRLYWFIPVIFGVLLAVVARVRRAETSALVSRR